MYRFFLRKNLTIKENLIILRNLLHSFYIFFFFETLINSWVNALGNGRLDSLKCVQLYNRAKYNDIYFNFLLNVFSFGTLLYFYFFFFLSTFRYISPRGNSSCKREIFRIHIVRLYIQSLYGHNVTQGYGILSMNFHLNFNLPFFFL